jgi:hypothetical protein
MKTESKKSVLELVKSQLQKVRLGNIAISVVNGDIEKRDAWWYVTVEPSTQPPSMHQYYEVLGNVEEELEAKHNIRVFLVPTVPD